jgi:hypothetical protein
MTDPWFLVLWTANSFFWLMAGASFMYKRRTGQDPISLPDFDLAKVWSMIKGRKPNNDEQDMIDGDPKPEAGRFTPSKMPGGSPREHHLDKADVS